MARPDITKLQLLDARHPGLLQRVDEMFEAFATIRAVKAMILGEYGERISHTPIWRYKQCVWNVRRQRALEEKATTTAREELASEGGN